MATHAIVLRILVTLASGLSFQDSPSRQPYAHFARLAISDVLVPVIHRREPAGGEYEGVEHRKIGMCPLLKQLSAWPVASLNESGQAGHKQRSQSPRNYAHITQMSEKTHIQDRTVGMARENSDLIYEAFKYLSTGLALLVQAGRPEDDIIVPTDSPGALDRKGAAKYLSIGTTKFYEMVGEGILPKGVMIGGRPHWFREDLDRYLRRKRRENSN